MQHPLQDMALWARTLGPTEDHNPRIERLRRALDEFRSRVEQLLQTLSAELPGLTVHDITHLDALWRVADQIIGPEYPLNPAEAFVLGGAILLHDAAHVMVAYPEGLKSVKQSQHWKDLIAQRYSGEEPQSGSTDEKAALFQVLRHLHAEQAHTLAGMSWRIPASSNTMFLLEDTDLRLFYGDLIGEIAESHHWPPQRVADEFDRLVPSPACLQPESWQVDAMKVAFILRTADAAHLDGARAPWFLFALHQPAGISSDHWRFQAKMGQPTLTSGGQLQLSAGAAFGPEERKAWWLAYDTACMVDRELRDASVLLRDHGRAAFAATSVLGADAPETFKQQARVRNWEPIDVTPKVGNAPHLIATLGGKALYGDKPRAALRELLQNSLDAIHALRGLGQMDPDKGTIEVSLIPDGDSHWWLHILDSGVGMSRYVLTEVLLDFGRSLWASDALRSELPGLATSGFDAIGKFGIGFFSVFMLGDRVKITSRRYQRAYKDDADQWQLEFDNGLRDRPLLTKATDKDRLAHSGTRISVRMTDSDVADLLYDQNGGMVKHRRSSEAPSSNDVKSAASDLLPGLVALVCPASDVEIRTRVDHDAPIVAVAENDWLRLTATALCARVQCASTPLVPLKTSAGEVLGRVGIDTSWLSNWGAVTINGVSSGAMRGLTGICKARSNSAKAVRTDATPAGATDDWVRWAKRAVAAIGTGDHRALVQLHPLIPERDLYVWKVRDTMTNFSGIRAYVRTQDEIVVLVGELEHESDDDVGRDRFTDEFCLTMDLVSCPDGSESRHPDFCSMLDVAPIDYHELIESALMKEWGDFDSCEDFRIIGEVNGIEISRFVFVYRRLEN